LSRRGGPFFSYGDVVERGEKDAFRAAFAWM
jgi:hypothetical protein